MTLWKQQDYRDNEKASSYQGLGWVNGWRAEEFYGSENTLYDAVIVDTCHYTVVQKHRTYSTPRMNLIQTADLGDYDGSLVVKMYHCG